MLYVLPGKQHSFMKPHSIPLGQAQTQGPNRHTNLPHRDTFHILLEFLLSAQTLQTESDVYHICFIILFLLGYYRLTQSLMHAGKVLHH